MACIKPRGQRVAHPTLANGVFSAAATVPDFAIRVTGADKAAAHLYDAYAPNEAKAFVAYAGQEYTDWARNNPNIAETSKFGLNVATSVAGIKAGLPKKAGRGHDDFAGAINHNIPLTEEYFRQQYDAGNVVQGGGKRLENLERFDKNQQINQKSNFNQYVIDEYGAKNNLSNIHYGHNVYDESFRTPEADKVGQDVLKAMEGVVSTKYTRTVNIMLHQDGTVSVGLSGDLSNPKTLERIQVTQQVLDKAYGIDKYTVGTDTLSDAHVLKPAQGGNQVGICAEPKCSMAAQVNPSPVIGFAIMWRGKGDNPYPIKVDEAKRRGLSSNQMYMCATCELNKDIYEQYINNSTKK